MNNFERLGLYPHNIEASKKIQKQFNDGAETVSIIHATGTGKTYNALYLALEHKDEKIVWIVPTIAIKEHIIELINNNPSISLREDFPNLEIITYQSLINMTKKEIKQIPCDLLIVDELHHLGAPIWGERIETFVNSHENMKKFGMTAYTVRDRGTIYERDMTNPETEEIFSDSVESVYDLYDAIIDGVLPKPIVKSVITENSETLLEIKEKIEILKRKNDQSYLEYEKILSDIITTIHKQNGVKELIQQSIKPNGKYIYFCPVLSEEGKNDINTIMDTMKNYLQEKYLNKNIVFYKSTSADGKLGKHHRDCFYNDKDLDGNDATNAIKIIFVKNQYNEGVHAPNVDGVFLGRRTKSDIVAFEQIGRALSVRGNTTEKIEEYSRYSIEQLKQIATSRGILIKENDTKQQIIEKLISPIIIDLADNLDFIEELENDLGNRLKEVQQKKEGNRRIIKITDSYLDIEVINKDLSKILKEVKERLNIKTWDNYYTLATAYYNYHRNSEIPDSFKTKNGYEYDKNGIALGNWCSKQRSKQEQLTLERKNKLEAIEFRFENKIIRMDWKEWYDLAVAYYNHHGNSEMPTAFKTKNGYEYDENGVALGKWCTRQRNRPERLTYERQKQLEDIKFRFINKVTRMNWEEWYTLATAYYNHHGNSEVPAKFKTNNGYEYDENGIALGYWCNKQRSRAERLTNERRKKLEDIGFRFINKVTIMNWEEWYTLATAYYNHHGNSEVPAKFKTNNGYEYDENGISLGKWCTSQRNRPERLTHERQKKLEAIEFRFENKKIQINWEEYYILAETYYNHHGNSEVPTAFKTKNGYEYNENGIPLGQWCSKQRTYQEKLTSEKRAKLDLIGFRFIKKEENHKRILKLCIEYSINSSKYNTINNIPYQELYAKIKFLNDNKIPLESGDKLHEIFYLSNENMKLKYSISKEQLIETYYINKKERGL